MGGLFIAVVLWMRDGMAGSCGLAAPRRAGSADQIVPRQPTSPRPPGNGNTASAGEAARSRKSERQPAGTGMALLEMQSDDEGGGLHDPQRARPRVDANELRVVLGPNGAGKTTLITMISGQYRPTAGRIDFAGQDITGIAGRIFHKGISRKFQVPNVYETLSVFDNVMISLQGDRKVFSTSGGGYAEERAGLGDPRVHGARRKARDAADTLSHGERQWLEIGMLMAAKPKLLLLDEPTTGMTEEGKQRTAELIHRIATNHTVLLVEHDMHIVRQIATGDGHAPGPGPRRRVPGGSCGERDGQRGLSREGTSLMLRSARDRHVLRHEPHPAQRVARGRAGRAAGVLGRNGAGKTTLLRSIIGLNPPSKGMVSFNGVEITR